jgi:phosphonate transport system ATP-binding protein
VSLHKPVSSDLLVLEDVSVAPVATGTPLLTGISLSLRRGECVALVGPSGAGKTTLLRTIALALAPRAGRIRLEGVDVSDLADAPLRRARRQVALVAQKHDLVEPLRVDRNVMAGKLGVWSNARALRYLVWATNAEVEEARAALGAVGLADKVKQPTTALSGGEQQRVAIARALVQAPALLLADEPVASLDPVTAQQVLGYLTDAARSHGMGLLMSLHQPDFAARYCDRILEVRGGTIVEAVTAIDRRA